LPKGWSLWLQLNDYEGPQLLSDFPSRLRENGYRRFLSLLIRRCLERRALGRCELALANSDYTRREVLSAYKEIPDSRIITLHKAVDLDFFDGPKSQLPISGRRFVFLGSNFEIKRLHLALEAFERLDSPSSTLEIAGCKLDEFIARHPRLAFAAKGSRVRFHGRLNREEVRSLLLRSDVLLLPSRQEAFGVAALEAIACGCRVIASRVGGLPEIVDRPGVGRLLEEATPAAWVYAMREELETPAIDERLRASVTTRFSSKTMLGRLAALYADKLIHEPLQ
jgi:glycosyltransferase involved in cell wall biosynthesis